MVVTQSNTAFSSCVWLGSCINQCVFVLCVCVSVYLVHVHSCYLRDYIIPMAKVSTGRRTMADIAVVHLLF